MFDTEPYKNPDHRDRRKPVLSFEELCKKRPEERTMPYFSICLEQLDADEKYNSLDGTDQGVFLRLLGLLWRANGLLQNYEKGIANDLNFTEEEWRSKRATFIGVGLLEVSPDGCSLVNRGLRQQYLNTLKNSNIRRNNKTKSNSS